MPSFTICKKLNYSSESIIKQKNIDSFCKHVSLNLSNFGYIEVSNTDKKIDFVFSIGGDGTMLHSIRNHINKGSTIIGINAGNVGFLTPYKIDDFISNNIPQLIKSSRIEKRTILKYSLNNKKVNNGFAVNDYAITSNDPNGMIIFSVEVENNGIISRAGTYRANALVISGPCGSTAYNMNTGGAIVDPTVQCLQLVMVAPTTLGTRPLILNNNSTIHIYLKTPGRVYSDGVLNKTLEISDKISISSMKKQAKILTPVDWNFFSAIAKKLHWNNGQDV